MRSRSLLNVSSKLLRPAARPWISCSSPQLRHYADHAGESPPQRLSYRTIRSTRGQSSRPAVRRRPEKTLLQQGQLFDGETGECLIDPRSLRQACACPRCIDPSDGQRNFPFTDIPEDIQVKSWDLDEMSTYHVTWTNDVEGFQQDHVSQYTARQIKKLPEGIARSKHNLYRRRLCFWERDSFSVEDNTLAYQDYMETDAGLAMALHHLWNRGLFFIKDVPGHEDSVQKLAERITHLRNTFYGATWDVKSKPDAENVAYTSRHLGYHMDLLYMVEPPGLQLLHCIENTCEGGESFFADTFTAIQHVEAQDPVAHEFLLKNNIMYEYSHGPFHYFDSKPVVRYNDNGELQRLGVPLRSAQDHPNPVNINRAPNRVYWSPPFISHRLSWSQPGGSGNAKTFAARKKFATTLDRPEARVETKLPPGTCAIFDNLRVVHARKSFDTNSGHRWLRGAYLDWQDYISKAASMVEQMPEVDKRGLIIGHDEASRFSPLAGGGAIRVRLDEEGEERE